MSLRVARWYLIVTSCRHGSRDKTIVWWFLASLFFPFLLMTSVKGIPRLAKARRPLFQSLWSVFVLSGSAITLYWVTCLFTQFRTNAVIVTITEERDTSLAFPAITLCNLNPLANTNITHGNLMAYMKATWTKRGSGGFNTRHLFDPETLVANAGTYFNNATASQFGHMSVGHGLEICQAENKQVSMYQASLGYCFTRTPPVTQGFIQGFSAILYLDVSLQIRVPFHELGINQPVSVGASLCVHKKNILSDLSNGAALLAGRNSHVNIRVQQRIRQPHPSSNCTRQAMLTQAPEYAYTQKSCLDFCSQNSFIKTWECIGDQVIFVPTLKRYNGEPSCGVLPIESMSRSPQNFSKEHRCLREVLSKPGRRCNSHCPVECEENRYQLTTESTIWPHNAFRLAFRRAYIINSPWSYRLDFFHEWIHSQNDTPGETAWKLKQIEKVDLLTRNLLQVIWSVMLDRVNMIFNPVQFHVRINDTLFIQISIETFFSNSKMIIVVLFFSVRDLVMRPSFHSKDLCFIFFDNISQHRPGHISSLFDITTGVTQNICIYLVPLYQHIWRGAVITLLVFT